MSMQRWNFLPRIKTWTEAENAAYVAHLGYATAREMGEDDGFIRHLILRTLLQSFTKYELSYIPMPIGDELSPYMKARGEFSREDPETIRKGIYG